MSLEGDDAYEKRRAEERWREAYERRMEVVEDRMDRHEIQCAERYKALADTLIAAGTSRNELRADVHSLRTTLDRNFRILLIALVLIAFAAVFQESTIIEFVRIGVRMFTDHGAAGVSPPQ